MVHLENNGFFFYKLAHQHKKPSCGTTPIDQKNIFPKKESRRTVADDQHLNSDANQLFETWPFENLASKIERVNTKIYTSTDSM